MQQWVIGFFFNFVTGTWFDVLMTNIGIHYQHRADRNSELVFILTFCFRFPCNVARFPIYGRGHERHRPCAKVICFCSVLACARSQIQMRNKCVCEVHPHSITCDATILAAIYIPFYGFPHMANNTRSFFSTSPRRRHRHFVLRKVFRVVCNLCRCFCYAKTKLS